LLKCEDIGQKTGECFFRAKALLAGISSAYDPQSIYNNPDIPQ
jgi:hypothetical protein